MGFSSELTQFVMECFFYFLIVLFCFVLSSFFFPFLFVVLACVYRCAFVCVEDRA